MLFVQDRSSVQIGSPESRSKLHCPTTTRALPGRMMGTDFAGAGRDDAEAEGAIAQVLLFSSLQMVGSQPSPSPS